MIRGRIIEFIFMTEIAVNLGDLITCKVGNYKRNIHIIVHSLINTTRVKRRVIIEAIENVRSAKEVG